MSARPKPKTSDAHDAAPHDAVEHNAVEHAAVEHDAAIQDSAVANSEVTPSGTRASKLKGVAGGKANQAHAVDAILDFDKIIHERARLAIVSALATSPSRTHNELREVLQLTDGNLSVHARKLEEAGYIACNKDFAGRTPRTTYKLTTSGRTAFEQYLAHMEALIRVMKTS